MTDISTAFHRAELGLAESAVSGAGEMKALCDDIDQRFVKLLVLQAPVATDLRMVVTAMHAAGNSLKRMCNLAQGAETAIVHQVSFLATGQRPEW